MAARNLAQLRFIITHQEVNAVLSSVFDVGHLFANTAVDDVFRGNTMALYQLKLRLKYTEIKTEQYSINILFVG